MIKTEEQESRTELLTDKKTSMSSNNFVTVKCKWLIKTGQYEVLEKRLRTVNEEVDSKYFKKVI